MPRKASDVPLYRDYRVPAGKSERHGDWLVRAEEVLTPGGNRPWDVYLLHEPSGNRVPLGPNLMPGEKADAEMARLTKVLYVTVL